MAGASIMPNYFKSKVKIAFFAKYAFFTKYLKIYKTLDIYYLNSKSHWGASVVDVNANVDHMLYLYDLLRLQDKKYCISAYC